MRGGGTGGAKNWIAGTTKREKLFIRSARGGGRECWSAKTGKVTREKLNAANGKKKSYQKERKENLKGREKERTPTQGRIRWKRGLERSREKLENKRRIRGLGQGTGRKVQISPPVKSLLKTALKKKKQNQ